MFSLLYKLTIKAVLQVSGAKRLEVEAGEKSFSSLWVYSFLILKMELFFDQVISASTWEFCLIPEEVLGPRPAGPKFLVFCETGRNYVIQE